MVDLLVSIAVIAVLNLADAPRVDRRERVGQAGGVPHSNMRQIGLGVSLYAESNKGEVPASNFIVVHNNQRDNNSQAALMMTIRLAGVGNWDGLGLLYSQEYVKHTKISSAPAITGITSSPATPRSSDATPAPQSSATFTTAARVPTAP